MADPKRYYKSLNLEPGASSESIKKQFRKLSLLTHPDRTNNDPKTNKQFHEISEAYQLLSDPKQKQFYDKGLSDNNMDDIQFNTENIFEIFKNMSFVDGRGQYFNMDNAEMNFGREIQRPTPIIKTLHITINQAFSGCKIPIKIERWVCNDSVKTKEEETLYVSIPKGVDDNEIIILREKGNILSETNKGHIKIFLKVTNKTRLVRNGLDLLYRKNINLKQALCGFSFELEYFDERSFRIDNGNGNVISHGYKKFIPGLGMERDGTKGNLIIEFTVTFPETLNESQVEKIKDCL